MKLYRVNEAGQMQTADLPDGVLPIALGATVNINGKDKAAITRIDYEKRLYWRGGDVGHSFPEHWIDEEGINALPWKDTP